MAHQFINARQAIRAIQSRYAGLLDPNEIRLGTARALNRTAAGVRTAASKEMRTVYAVKAGAVSKSAVKDKAYTNKQNVAIGYEGRPLPLNAFPYRATAKGVSVTIRKGNKATIQKAFVAIMPNGHVGIYARGYYGESFNFRIKRLKKATKGTPRDKWPNDLPITELTTKSVAGMFLNEKVSTRAVKSISEILPKRLEHELSRLLAKKGGAV